MLLLQLAAPFLFPSALPVDPPETARLTHGALSVELNEYGVLVGVPDPGLRGIDGPAMPLEVDFAEWFGVTFDTSSEHFDGCGPGVRDDWAGRPTVDPVSFEVEGARAVAISRRGPLEIRHAFWFDPAGPYLIASARLTNLGDEPLRNVLYTREVSIGDPRTGFTFPSDLVGMGSAPDDVMRRVWMLNDLEPGGSAGVGCSWALGATTPPSPSFQGVDVPLALYTSANFPAGLVFGATNGVSWGDYDADGWPDVFALSAATLWQNQGGADFVLAADLDSVLPFTNRRYGSSFGDYDADGLPDIGTEPRDGWGGDECFHLLHNLGGGPNFVDVATNPAIVDQLLCNANSETICWGDVDGDADMDMFFPVYPAWAFGGPGNSFLRNLGPTGPGGAFRFQEFTAAGGFDNPPPDSARPEGAQFVDLDADGDMELYSNGTLYQNVSTPGTPDMDWMTEAGSGIRFHDELEEGAGFGDHDLDGDFDLFIVYSDPARGVFIWENYGDGYFFAVESGVIQSPNIGLDLGLSAEDWDNDGDIDFTTRSIFRRNMFVEQGGVRRYTVATHNIPPAHITSATPAWADHDRDGDLDCALGNWLNVGRMYENTTYDAATPDDQRRYVRVRPLTDSVAVPAGLESEYATSVEIVVHGDASGWRRKKFTSSSAGYLNQNEYTLSFALPDDPFPDDDDEDLRFDVIADFPSLPSQGFWRVDRHVNPILGGLNLARLAQREIVVFRGGLVSIDGVDHPPCGSESPLLVTAADGLVTPTPTAPAPIPVDAPGPDHFVGLAFDTLGASRPVRVREIVLDGELSPATACGSGSANLFLWDVTGPGAPLLVASLDEATSKRNRRSYVTTDVVLEVEREYRLVAHVAKLRATSFAGPRVHPDLTVRGGLSFSDADPCSGAATGAAALDASAIYLTLRYGAIDGIATYCVGAPNTVGPGARISAQGSLGISANDFMLTAAGAVPMQAGLFFYGPNQVQIPFGDGFRCVAGGALGTFRLNPPANVDAAGALARPLDFTQPPADAGPGEITAGSTWNFQFWYRDPTSPGSFNLSNGLQASFCP